MFKKDLIILGAGACGLFIASQLKMKNCLVVEQNSSPGIKLSACGGGFCNFSNRHISIQNYISKNPRFCHSALSAFPSSLALEMINKFNLPWEERDHGRLFLKVRAIKFAELMHNQAIKNGIEFCFSTTIDQVTKTEAGFSVSTDKGEYITPRLIVALGGRARVLMGASDTGLKIAESLGLKLTAQKPALSPLLFHDEEKSFYNLQGISIPVTCFNNGIQWKDDLLFTHNGISGPIGLQLSNYDYSCPEFDFLPALSIEELIGLKNNPNMTLYQALQKVLPKRLIHSLLDGQFGPKFTLNRIKPCHLESLHSLLKQRTIAFKSTAGYDRAEIMSGGVDTKELSPKTMESKKVPGLFFCGEALDVAGWLGGYNLHWAWASANCIVNHVNRSKNSL